jgi:hypothetical protein
MHHKYFYLQLFSLFLEGLLKSDNVHKEILDAFNIINVTICLHLAFWPNAFLLFYFLVLLCFLRVTAGYRDNFNFTFFLKAEHYVDYS